MVRWEPNARERLQEAAVELFRERGYDRVTVSEIAARAGLTERTYFRYFADKREVLFAGSEVLRERLVEHVRAAPADVPTFELARDAVVAIAETLQRERTHEYARMRWALVAAHAELQERELIKLAAMGDALAAALRDRGVPESHASLAAKLAIGIFEVAFGAWASAEEPSELRTHVRSTARTLRGIVRERAATR
jgi:AcrR family transcriptional regulator